MGNDSNAKKLATTATTTLGSVMLYGICINKVLTGSIVINEGSTNVGVIATSTIAGVYHAAPNGVRYSNLVMALTAADDVTTLIRAI